MIRLLLLVVILIGLAVLAQVTGLINVDTIGSLRAPSIDVRVSGGEAPKVQVETAKVKVGVTERTVEVPAVDVGMKNREVDLPTVDVDKARDEGGTSR